MYPARFWYRAPHRNRFDFVSNAMLIIMEVAAYAAGPFLPPVVLRPGLHCDSAQLHCGWSTSRTPEHSPHCVWSAFGWVALGMVLQEQPRIPSSEFELGRLGGRQITGRLKDALPDFEALIRKVFELVKAKS